MISFRRPKGTYVRLTPDWFSGDAAAGFGFGNSGTGSDPAVGLFNNDTAGRSLFVYGLGASNEGTEVVNWSFFNGPGFLLLPGQTTFPIDPTLGQPIGQIYSGLTAAQDANPPRTTQTGLYLSNGPNGGPQGQLTPFFAPYPLAIIRTGYMLAAWNLNNVISAFFYYVVASF